jgi:hypothetical protein
VVIYDPAYLTEPFIRTTDFAYNPQQRMAPYPCESVNEGGRPEGVVPAHLPGDKLFSLGIPGQLWNPSGEAARGGAETMYPEYIAKMKSMKTLPRPKGKHSDR